MTMPGTVSSTSPGRIIGRDLELRCGDGALARRRRDADQVLGGPLDVGDVAEGRRARDDDVRPQRQQQGDIARRRLPRRTVSVRRSTVKLINRKVSSAGPAGTPSNRNAPTASVTPSSAPDVTSRP